MNVIWRNLFYTTLIVSTLNWCVRLFVVVFNGFALFTDPEMARVFSWFLLFGLDFCIALVAFGYSVLFSLLFVPRCTLVSMRRRKAHWVCMQILLVGQIIWIITNWSLKITFYSEHRLSLSAYTFFANEFLLVFFDLGVVTAFMSVLMFTLCDCTCVTHYSDFVDTWALPSSLFRDEEEGMERERERERENQNQNQEPRTTISL